MEPVTLAIAALTFVAGGVVSGATAKVGEPLRGVEPIAPQMISFAQDYLGLTVPEQTERPVAWCIQRWPGEGAVLVVVDDVQDYGALKEMLPGAGAGDGRFWVLLTTREAVLAEGQRLAL